MGAYEAHDRHDRGPNIKILRVVRSIFKVQKIILQLFSQELSLLLVSWRQTF